MSCSSSGTFSAQHECIPVSCGGLPEVEYATMKPQRRGLRFPMSVEYTCELGFTVDGQRGGPRTFSVGCQMDGQLTSSSAHRCRIEGTGLVATGRRVRRLRRSD